MATIKDLLVDHCSIFDDEESYSPTRLLLATGHTVVGHLKDWDVDGDFFRLHNRQGELCAAVRADAIIGFEFKDMADVKA